MVDRKRTSCNEKSPKAKDERYRCSETNRWVLRDEFKKRKSVTKGKHSPKKKAPICNEKSLKAKDERYRCSETIRWVLRDEFKKRKSMTKRKHSPKKKEKKQTLVSETSTEQTSETEISDYAAIMCVFEVQNTLNQTQDYIVNIDTKNLVFQPLIANLLMHYTKYIMTGNLSSFRNVFIKAYEINNYDYKYYLLYYILRNEGFVLNLFGQTGCVGKQYRFPPFFPLRLCRAKYTSSATEESAPLSSSGRVSRIVPLEYTRNYQSVICAERIVEVLDLRGNHAYRTGNDNDHFVIVEILSFYVSYVFSGNRNNFKESIEDSNELYGFAIVNHIMEFCSKYEKTLLEIFRSTVNCHSGTQFGLPSRKLLIMKGFIMVPTENILDVAEDTRYLFSYYTEKVTDALCERGIFSHLTQYKSDYSDIAQHFTLYIQYTLTGIFEHLHSSLKYSREPGVAENITVFLYDYESVLLDILVELGCYSKKIKQYKLPQPQVILVPMDP